MPTSGSSVIRARLSKTSPSRRDPVIRPTSEPTKNACTPKDVMQAVEEDEKSARKEANCPSSVLVLYCAISGPTRKRSHLSEEILAAVVVGAAVGVVDPPPPPSGGFFPDLDQKR